MFDNKAKLTKWTHAMLSVGARESNSTKSNLNVFASNFESTTESVNMHKLEQIKIEAWTLNDVVDWLGFIVDNKLKQLSSFYNQTFIENEINGEVLSQITEEQLAELGVEDAHIQIILREVAKVKQQEGGMFFIIAAITCVSNTFFIVFSIKKYCIAKKLAKFMDSQQLSDMDSEIDNIMEALCDVEKMKKFYLNVLNANEISNAESVEKSNPTAYNLFNS